MGESFLFNIAESLLGKIASAALGELSLAHGLKADLTKLQSTLSNVKAVILDAEEQQLTNHEVCTWLAQLKEVLYEAEDVFDEFAYEALMNNIHGGINKKVRRFFSRSSNPIAFRLKMSSKVKEIREAFDEVAANKAKLHLSAHLVVNRPHWLKDREMTHSFVHAPEIIGRDRDRDVIVQSLTDSPQSLDENVSVVSIVGIGGLGKTALTKMVYNHARVAQHFEERVWICLGDLAEFNVNKVMVKLVKILSRGNNDSSEPELLQNCIRDYFKNKKFLLVLDDVWDVDRANWLELKNLLRCGVSGSKVVITTRNSSVASYMDSILTHKLEGLSHDKCVILFKKFAFRTGEDSQNLMEIGDEVVRKCQGVPLAVKTLGCLLFSKRSKNDWEYVRDNKIWKLEQKKDDILPALKLSYDQLPFVLKQCFVYCSVFPKDHEFDNIQLVQHWLAFGFLQSSNESTKFEDIGGQYINELCCRGFFQDFSHRDSIEFSFKMHDLIHDLALFVAQNEFENMYIGSFSDQEVYKGIRHVSFCERTSMVGKEVSISSTESSTKNGVMPTIWSMCFARNLAWNDQIVKQCMSMFNRTRLLDLSYCTLLEQLPDSIGTLKHLRYLNLNECWSLERLPDSISSLYNLQTLLLEGCDELQVLPKCTEDLINIRFLLITTKQKHLSLRFERLCSLQNLVFDRCENLECVFERTELDKLTSLRKLIISECKSLTSLFLPPIMTLITSAKKELTPLETLTIVGCPNLDLNSTCNDGISLPRLKSLVFSKLPQMESLPRWIFQGCASTLEFLKIEDCTNLTMLPEWIQSFTALKQLLIGGCPILSKRCKPGIGEDWPKIKHISKILLNGVLQLKQEDDDQLEEEDDDEEEEEDDEEEEDRDDHDDEEQEEEDEEEDDKEEEEEVYEYIRLQEAVSRRL